MIDAVLTHPHHPSLCGVAKFSHRLARELGVPCGNIIKDADKYKHPLVSIKAAEMVYPSDCHWSEYDLFLHDDAMPLEAVSLKNASTVYAANSVIAMKIRQARPDVIEAWCPSTIEGNAHRGTINVLTFGMAHKIQTARYEKLKTLLDATGADYTVSVSTAVHEGSPWDETALVGDKLRAIFGNHLRVLGYLADDALVSEMARCTAVALFFDPALRANNTTFWAATNLRKPIVTNRDHYSPIVRGASLIRDIDEMSEWFPEYYYMEWIEGVPSYSWDNLKALLKVQPCAK